MFAQIDTGLVDLRSDLLIYDYLSTCALDSEHAKVKMLTLSLKSKQ